MNYKTRTYPIFAACGLNCGLCPNFYLHTNGVFKCPSSGGENFSEQHPHAYIAEQTEKVGILSELLGKLNDGRRKTFFCLAVNLFELQDIQYVMDDIGNAASAEMTL